MAARPNMTEAGALIGQYSHEAHRPRADVALHTLRRIASMVKPIMRQRGWRVGTLSEFYPHQQNLLGLNINGGQRICVRLRYPGDQTLFLPFEEVVDTMLHELTHIVFGPHNDKFHRLWNELRDEYEALVRKGYTGEGFLSPGYHLGGSGSKPPHELRRMARAAAEKRRAQSGLGPRRVGGSGPSNMVDIRKTIADAAQRRRDILRGCGDTETDSKMKDQVLEETRRNGVQTAAEIDDAYMQAIQQAFMDMVKEDAVGNNDTEASPIVMKDPLDRSTRYSNLDLTTETIGSAHLPINPAPNSDEDKWECPICTFLNPSTYLCCEVCLIERPSDPATSNSRPPRPQPTLASTKAPPGDHKVLRSRAAAANIARFKEAEENSINSKPLGWVCHRCGKFMENEWWLCSTCGTMKLSS